MKFGIQHKIVIMSIFLGLFAGLVDTFVGYFIFSKGKFLDLLILKVPAHEIYGRAFLFLACVGFGVVIAKLVSRQVELQNTVEMAKREWEETFDTIRDAITIHDKDFNIIRSNKAAAKLLRLPFRKLLTQKCYQSFHGTSEPPEQCPVCAALKAGTPCTAEIYEPTLNKHLEIKAIPRFNKNHEIIGLVHVVSDITKRVLSEDALRAMSLTDELTGLHNRRGFMAMAAQQMKLADRTGKKKFLLYADMDNLKAINDKLGHQEGDLAIIEIALVLEENFRQSDIIARIGGDEFVVLPVESDSEDIEVIISRLQGKLKELNASRPPGFELSLSIGVAYYDPVQPLTINELLEEADRIMYEEKKKKKSFVEQV